jgi:plastocyanin
MKSRPFPVIVCGTILIALLLVTAHVVAGDKKSKQSLCSNAHPEQLCTAANTCGSSSSPCVMEVRRSGGGTDATVTPNIADFPKKSVICINPGTTVTWQGGGKNTGIVVDFGASSPFEPSGTIMGGSDRPVTVLTKKAGCYKYTVGACTPGTVYGMCGNSDFELIVASPAK